MLHVASQILITSLNFMLAPPAPLVYLTLTYSIFMIEYEIGIFSKNMSAENFSRRQVLKMIFGVAASGAALVATGCGAPQSPNASGSVGIPDSDKGDLIGCKHAVLNDTAESIAKEFKQDSQARTTVQRGLEPKYDGPANGAPGLEVTVPRNIAGTPMPELTISDNVCVYKKGQ